MCMPRYDLQLVHMVCPLQMYTGALVCLHTVSDHLMRISAVEDHLFLPDWTNKCRFAGDADIKHDKSDINVDDRKKDTLYSKMEC